MPNSPVSVRLLGGFEIHVDGVVALSQASRRKKPLALVKLLALQPDREMHRDLLLATLWPELSQAAAAAQLRKNRLYLRQSMEACGWREDLLDLAGDAIRLAGSLTADTDTFQRAARTALDRVLTDEVRHRDFGWLLLEWLSQHSEWDKLAASIQQELPAWLEQLMRGYGDAVDAPFDEACRAWGMMPNAEYRAALLETIERDYIPRFAEYGIDARAAFRG